MKRNLYVTSKSEIRRDGNTIRIKTEKDTVTVPISVIANLFLFGRIKLSSGARNFLLANNAEIVFMSASGRLDGILSNTKLRSNYHERLRQYKAYEEDPVPIARLCVVEKIRTIQDDCSRSLQHYIDHAKEAESVDRLRGVEGSASTYMFGKIREELAEVGIDFTERSYHPPADEVNSLLSFVYTLHYAHIYAIVLSKGLDPYIGFLHQKRGRHAPLASDIMESQRVALTRFVVSLFLDGAVTLEDFGEKHRLESGKMREIIRSYSALFIYDESSRENLESFIQSLVGAF